MSDTEDTGIKKLIKCSFCSKGRQQVEQMIEGPMFSGEHIYICNECGFGSNIEKTGQIKECPKCKGKGAETESGLPCLKCGGKGVVLKK